MKVLRSHFNEFVYFSEENKKLLKWFKHPDIKEENTVLEGKIIDIYTSKVKKLLQ